MTPRKITAQELADLSDEWENPTVDTSKYYQSVGRAWEVDRPTYTKYRKAGGLCQQNNDRYYIA